MDDNSDTDASESQFDIAKASFYGCYLLVSVSPLPAYKGRTYVGFTVNPNRRIKQHNRGHKGGGAKKTSSRGPWEMILIVHGFPNDICALRFEWAWQNPDDSRRLRGRVSAKTKKESQVDYKLRILGTLLRTGPWCRLPLTLRWLKRDYARDMPVGCEPPTHMPITYGSVCTLVVPKGRVTHTQAQPDLHQTVAAHKCSVCGAVIEEPSTRLSCLSPSCSAKFHIKCLAAEFLKSSGELGDFMLPLEGNCPKCKATLLWGHVVKTRPYS